MAPGSDRAADPANIARGLHWFQQARTLRSSGQAAGAMQAYRQALALLPDHPVLLSEAAACARDLANWPLAETLFRKIGSLRPDSGFEGNLGYALFRLQRHADAMPLLRTHLRAHPDDTGILRALGAASVATAQWQEALACGRRLAQLAPPAQSLDLLLNSLFYMGDGDALDALLEAALATYPDNPGIQAIGGLHLLKRGDHQRGFTITQTANWGQALSPTAVECAAAPLWDGTPFAGTLVVIGEQGPGEEILASGFFAALQATGQHAVIECDPRLLAPFRRSFPGLQFVPRGEHGLRAIVAAGAPVRRVRSLDLGVHFGRRPQQEPTGRAWLQPDPARVQQLRADYQRRWPGKKLVGISWASRRLIHGEHGKSAPLASFAPLLSRTDVVTVSCQYGDTDADLNALAAAGLPRPYVNPAIDAAIDLDGLLAQLAALDLIVTVSNTTAHLAGAAGRPCELLLPHRQPVFWYWGYQGETTPWYPAIRIHRNGSGHDWQALVAQVTEHLPIAAE